MNQAHIDADDCAEWAVQNMAQLRTPRNGLDYQGRFPMAAEAATEVGADQYESADGEVALFMVKTVAAICFACFLVWGL